MANWRSQTLENNTIDFNEGYTRQLQIVVEIVDMFGSMFLSWKLQSFLIASLAKGK